MLMIYRLITNTLANSNNFPHSTFNWVGLDGTQILTHMTPVNSYNAQCDINEIRAGQAGNKNLEVTKQALILFGNGDGGGGPTPPMLEKLRRARALVTVGEATTTDIPLVKMGGSFDEFFESIKEETDNGAKLPNWLALSLLIFRTNSTDSSDRRGELYFELHRGVSRPFLVIQT
jgi:alpha-mannosidase